MYRYNSAKKPRTRITYERGKLSAFKSSNTEEEKNIYMHVYISPAPLCKKAEIDKEREREREKRERAKRDERGRRKDFRYDIASRYLNRLAATRTHCVKLISIFGDGRERVKNLERVYVIPRQNQGARARGRGLNEQGVREGANILSERTRRQRVAI